MRNSACEFYYVIIEKGRADLERNHHRGAVYFGENVVLQIESRIEFQRFVSKIVGGRFFPGANSFFEHVPAAYRLEKYELQFQWFERAQPRGVQRPCRVSDTAQCAFDVEG